MLFQAWPKYLYPDKQNLEYTLSAMLPKNKQKVADYIQNELVLAPDQSSGIKRRRKAEEWRGGGREKTTKYSKYEQE